MVKASGTPEPIARRRRSGELSELILDAARELFASKGYAGTSSREIADRAGVYEPSIYRRFGSKAKLFEAAVIAPFNDAISTYLEAWQSQVDEPKTTEDLVRQFIEPLYRTLAEHRELLLALISAREFHGDLVDEAQNWSLDSVLQRMEPQAQVETLRRALSADPRLTVRVAAGLVMGVTLLDPLLIADGANRPSPDEILEEMVRIVTYGVETRAESGASQPPPQSAKRRSTPVSPELAQVLDRLADAERRAVRAELEIERLRKEVQTPPGNGDGVHAIEDAPQRRAARRQPPRRRAGG